MTEELKKDLEEGMRKFVSMEPNKARWKMRDEIKQVLQKHGISVDEGIVIAQGAGHISVYIRFEDGKRYGCDIWKTPVEFTEIGG